METFYPDFITLNTEVQTVLEPESPRQSTGRITGYLFRSRLLRPGKEVILHDFPCPPSGRINRLEGAAII